MGKLLLSKSFDSRMKVSLQRLGDQCAKIHKKTKFIQSIDIVQIIISAEGAKIRKNPPF